MFILPWCFYQSSKNLSSDIEDGSKIISYYQHVIKVGVLEKQVAMTLRIKPRRFESTTDIANIQNDMTGQREKYPEVIIMTFNCLLKFITYVPARYGIIINCSLSNYRWDLNIYVIILIIRKLFSWYLNICCLFLKLLSD